jgi:hypothetical protein
MILGLMNVKPQRYQWGMFGLPGWCLAFPIVVDSVSRRGSGDAVSRGILAFYML